MKKTFALKPLALSLTVAAASVATVAPATVQAGVSANVGLVSTYIYRGVQQTADASASAGLDYENESGIYAGVWGADVGGGTAGLEYDVYAGWAGEFEGVSLGLGLTTYNYTGTFDTSYKEYNLSVGYGPVSIAYANGSWEDAADDGKDAAYTDLNISAGYEGFSATYGIYQTKDSDVAETAGASSYIDNKYLMVGYSMELTKGLEGSVTYVKSDKEDKSVKDSNDLVFGLTYLLDIM